MKFCSILLFAIGASAFTTTTTLPSAQFKIGQKHTRMNLFNFGTSSSSGGSASVPKSSSDRDNQAIQAVKAAISNPRNPSNPLLECEFPALEALNKLGDGSLRSALEAEDANLAFVQKLIKGIRGPFGSEKVALVVSSAASNSFLSKAQKIGGVTLYSLKDGVPNCSSQDVCIFVTPSTRNDYKIANSLAESNQAKAVVIVNGFAKDQKSISGSATMAYFLKPLTYNSQIAGYLIRSYPSDWTVLDGFSKEVLGTYSDDEILVKKTNTPDLRNAGRLVQKSVDERAIRARQK
ncbi:hypothetical protein CTEN210_03372 [Chaetoceros tenuissimus]|uniref:DUF1995 domain-containing protein n=1 Tax=Chaetoceros tenuissimus TaxID=426638 RepID=A0AAD3CJ78_9STRA|nr:hypothetical protein CTEN210_03372 [Chaetoceros tenuissimus]